MNKRRSSSTPIPLEDHILWETDWLYIIQMYTTDWMYIIQMYSGLPPLRMTPFTATSSSNPGSTSTNPDYPTSPTSSTTSSTASTGTPSTASTATTPFLEFQWASRPASRLGARPAGGVGIVQDCLCREVNRELENWEERWTCKCTQAKWKCYELNMQWLLAVEVE